MVRGAVTMIGGLLSSVALAQGAPIVFSAPPELRAEITATLKEKGRISIDLSELDGALYGGPEGAKARLAAGKAVTLKASLPKEVRADFATGQAACRARSDQTVEARRGCAEQLVGAVWERHLERLRPELVLEFRTTDMLEMAIYRPGEATISGRMLPFDLNPTPRGFVLEALEGPYPTLGSRPNSLLLPTASDAAATPASLSQGAPQSLAAIEVPKGCTLPRELVVEPAEVPLAVTISTLWRATAAAHVRQGAAKPARCTLALTGDRARPTDVSFTCGNELASLPLKSAPRFGEKSFQAELAKMFVTGQVLAQCAETVPLLKRP